MIKRKFILCFLLLYACFTSLKAEETFEVPLDLQFKMLVQAATYNRTLISKNINQLRIALVFPNDSQASDIVKKIEQKFSGENVEVRKFQLLLFPLQWQSIAQLEKDLLTNDINVLYITPGNLSNLSQIKQLSMKLKLLSTTGIPQYVHTGITLGVGNQGARPEFLFNAESAELQGVDFDSNFLRMVKVINR